MVHLTRQPSKEAISKYRSKPEIKERYARQQRERRANNPEKYRAYSKISERRRKLKKYGLTESSYNQLLEEQFNLCAICKEPNKLKRDWHVDHCHKTGKIRGILCHHCNLMLGNAKDNRLILSSGVDYLERYYE